MSERKTRSWNINPTTPRRLHARVDSPDSIRTVSSTSSEDSDQTTAPATPVSRVKTKLPYCPESLLEGVVGRRYSRQAQREATSLEDCFVRHKTAVLTPSRIHKRVVRFLQKDLTVGEREGFVYALVREEAPNFVKISFTSKDLTETRRSQHRKCSKNKTIHIITEDIMSETKYCKRLEMLVHAELSQFRRREKICNGELGAGCSMRIITMRPETGHNEWFEVDPEVAKECIYRWKRWLDEGLYDMGTTGTAGNLNHRWKDNLGSLKYDAKESFAETWEKWATDKKRKLHGLSLDPAVRQEVHTSQRSSELSSTTTAIIPNELPVALSTRDMSLSTRMEQFIVNPSPLIFMIMVLLLSETILKLALELTLTQKLLKTLLQILIVQVLAKETEHQQRAKRLMDRLLKAWCSTALGVLIQATSVSSGILSTTYLADPPIIEATIPKGDLTDYDYRPSPLGSDILDFGTFSLRDIMATLDEEAYNGGTVTKSNKPTRWSLGTEKRKKVMEAEDEVVPTTEEYSLEPF